ncbi:hypothetical protein JJ691_86650 [Kutzneria sp. CA-103260]|nr:hypothetical protein JJ691_86650 [Kutzneria sp. CA-103260]
MAATESTVDGMLLVLPERDEAEALAAELARLGWQPCAVHKELLAGEDDAEDADWLVELATAPDGTPAAAHADFLTELADRADGFVTSIN